MENLHRLGFTKIIILEDDIAEVIINEGVELDSSMVEEYHRFLLEHLKAPFSLLINKINSYTYTFDAQMKIATLAEIHAMAVVSYNSTTEVSTRSLASMPRSKKWNIQIFPDRETAVSWLELQQQSARTYLEKTESGSKHQHH